jgi:hypothetical protein
LGKVPQGIVKDTASGAAPTPDEWTVRAAARRVEPHQDADVGTRIAFEHIELLVDGEAVRECPRGGSSAILDDDPLGARHRVVTELRADELDVTRPVMEGVGRGVKAD